MPGKIHEFLVEKIREKLSREGYKTSKDTILAVNEAGINIEQIKETGIPDLVAVKEKEVLLVDVIDKTYGSEMVEKVEKYGKLGKVVFVFAAETFKNVEFWSLNELSVSKEEVNQIK